MVKSPPVHSHNTCQFFHCWSPFPLPGPSLLDDLISEEKSTHRLSQHVQKPHGFLFFVCRTCVMCCFCVYMPWHTHRGQKSLPSNLRQGLLFTCVCSGPAGPQTTDLQGVHQILALQVCTARLALCGLRGSELRSHLCKQVLCPLSHFPQTLPGFLFSVYSLLWIAEHFIFLGWP